MTSTTPRRRPPRSPRCRARRPRRPRPRSAPASAFLAAAAFAAGLAAAVLAAVVLAAARLRRRRPRVRVVAAGCGGALLGRHDGLGRRASLRAGRSDGAGGRRGSGLAHADPGGGQAADDGAQALGVLDVRLLARGAQLLGAHGAVGAPAQDEVLQGGVLELTRKSGMRGLGRHERPFGSATPGTGPGGQMDIVPTPRAARRDHRARRDGRRGRQSRGSRCSTNGRHQRFPRARAFGGPTISHPGVSAARDRTASAGTGLDGEHRARGVEAAPAARWRRG